RRHTRFSRDWSSDVCSSDLVAEEALTQAFDTFIGIDQCRFVITAGKPDAAATGGALEHQRVAEPAGGGQCFVEAAEQAGTRCQRYPGGLCYLAGAVLE